MVHRGFAVAQDCFQGFWEVFLIRRRIAGLSGLFNQTHPANGYFTQENKAFLKKRLDKAISLLYLILRNVLFCSRRLSGFLGGAFGYAYVCPNERGVLLI